MIIKVQTGRIPSKVKRHGGPSEDTLEILRIMRAMAPGAFFTVQKRDVSRITNLAVVYFKGRYSMLQHEKIPGVKLFVKRGKK